MLGPFYSRLYINNKLTLLFFWSWLTCNDKATLYAIVYFEWSPPTPNRDQPEVQLFVGTFEVHVLAHVASRISLSPSIRHLGKFPCSFDRRLFSYIRQNIGFRNRQMLLKGQKCPKKLSKRRIDGVFLYH